MPELPEVECLTRAVRRVLKGGRLVEAEFFRKALRDPIPIDEFEDLVVGQRVDDVFRRSKYMLFRTAKGFAVFHLGMTGNVLVTPRRTAWAPHTHVVLELADGRDVRFVDPRRFGMVDLVTRAAAEVLGLASYGVAVGGPGDFVTRSNASSSSASWRKLAR